MGKLQKDSLLAKKHTIVFEKKIIIKLSSFLVTFPTQHITFSFYIYN